MDGGGWEEGSRGHASVTSGKGRGVSTDGALGRSQPDVGTEQENAKGLDGVVRLLHETRIPPGYQKLVRPSVNRELEKGLMLFTPQVDQPDLVMEDSAVEVGEETYVTLVVQNHGMEPVQLDSGMRLGEVVPIELVERERGEMAEEASVKRLEPSIETAGDRVADLLEQLDLRFEHLTQTQRQQIIRLLSSYADTFALNPSELGTTQLVTHSIDTGEHWPIRQPVRRTPFALRGKIEEMVQEMLQQGVIEPSRSPWASPIVLVKRKDGGVRFCVDYRKLNAVTKLDEFPLPRIDDTLDLLAGSCFFTTLHLASGFWQVRMESTSQERTAFTTFAGLYEFKKMTFGLAKTAKTVAWYCQNRGTTEHEILHEDRYSLQLRPPKKFVNNVVYQ